MKYGDLSSIVQLGVGLHVGTSILQLYGEIGAEALVRTLARINGLLPEAKDPELIDEYEQLASDYEIFKIRLFNEYKKYIKLNGCVAASLASILTIIAFKADDTVTDSWMMAVIFIIALSLLPAVCTFFVLWYEASRLVSPMKTRADSLETRVLRLHL